MPAPRSKSTRSAKTTDTKSVTVLFEEDRETKGTYRFKEVENGKGNRHVMGTIWVRKDVCDDLGLDGEQLVEVTLKAVAQE